MPPAKKASKRATPAGRDGSDSLGVSEAQLERIVDQVCQRLAKSVAPEVVSSLPGTEAQPSLTVPPGATASHEDNPAAAVPPAPAPREDQVAETAVQALMYGESDPKTPPLADSSSTPLAYHVSDRLREKIKSNKYVDFKHLLPGNADMSYTLRLDSGTGDPAVHLASTTPAKPVNSIDSWLTAYTTYQFVYLQAFPQAGPDLLKYQDTVRDLHRRFGFPAARYYDENFRSLKERVPELSFSSTHSELWLKAATLQAPANNSNHPFLGRPNNPRARHPSPSSTKGHCYDYNAKGKWCNNSPCRYPHTCSLCQGPHPQFACKQAAASPRNNPGPSRGARTPSSGLTSTPNPGKSQ